jgi:AraC-like DNA-binding protein
MKMENRDEILRQRVFRLRPFVRLARADWRGPWVIEERRLMDYLLVYIDRGAGFFSIDGRGFSVGPGDLIWFPPNALHEMRGDSPRMHVLYIHFDLLYDKVRSARARILRGGERNLGADERFIHPMLKDPLIGTWRGKLPVANAAAIHALIWQVAVEDQGGRDPLLCAGLILQIVGEIARGLSPAATRARGHWPSLQRAAEEILRQAGQPLNIPALAQQAHLSVSHFRRLFREVHNKSPRDYHELARANKACEMILQTRSTITAISRELGFSTVHNFSRAFRRMLGVSPRAYRKRAI